MSAVLPIASVRVFEDRAQVTRRGTVSVREGSNALSVEGVSPLLVDRTVEVRVGEPVVVLQHRARRWLDTSRVDRLAGDPELEQTFDDATDELRRRTQDVERRRRQIDGFATARRLTLTELSLQANEVQLDAAEAARGMALLRDSERAARIGLVGDQAALRDAEREWRDLDARRQASGEVTDSWRAAIDVELSVPGGEAAEVELEVRYVVANAAWRPAHVAQRDADGTAVALRSEAVVWQATEEVWDGVELVLSTARSSRATDPPTVEDDILRLVETGREIEIEWREVDDHIGEGPAFVELPSVDDGGEPQELRAGGPVTVLADGLPTRIPLDVQTVPAEADLVCRPEREVAVHRRTRQVNGGRRPLLAGPMLLVEEGGVVGWTTIGFVAPAERFEIGWGPDAAVTVDRRTERSDDDGITGSSATTYRSITRLHHQGDGPRVVQLIERVPVSELDRVKVTIDRAEPGADPDADGFLHRSVSLDGPGTSAELSLAYTVRRSRNVSGG